MEDLGRYIREEADEVGAAVTEGDREHIAEELGDLLFNILHAARIGEEEGAFTLETVLRGVRDKIIRRHPHVFGDAKATTTEEGLAHWERVKGEEKRDRNK